MTSVSDEEDGGLQIRYTVGEGHECEVALGVQRNHQAVIVAIIVVGGLHGEGLCLEGAPEGEVVTIEVDLEGALDDLHGDVGPPRRAVSTMPGSFDETGGVVGHVAVVRLELGAGRSRGIDGATGTTDLDVATDATLATIADFTAVAADVGVAARATVTIDATGTAGVRIEGTTGAGGSRVVVVRGRGAPGAACRQDEDHPDGEEDGTHGVPPFSPRGPPPETQERTFEKQNPYLSGKLLRKKNVSAFKATYPIYLFFPTL